MYFRVYRQVRVNILLRPGELHPATLQSLLLPGRKPMTPRSCSNAASVHGVIVQAATEPAFYWRTPPPCLRFPNLRRSMQNLNLT
jgi:hypothetical protein